MANEKGNTLGAGRPKGTANKATAQAREAIAAFVDGNADRLTGWLDQIAETNPKAAFDSFMSVVEYHIPKLARHTHAGDADEPLKAEITVIERVIKTPNET
jgi:hypothetical protein